MEGKLGNEERDGPVQKGAEEERPTWKGAVIKDKSIWFKARCGSWDAAQVRFNPVVSSLAVLFIASFVTWCIVDGTNANEFFKSAKNTVATNFTWLYVGSYDIWAVALMAIYFSKYGALKLGADDDEPEYPNGSWFCMLFACGVGVGLFFYGVGEPIAHYTLPNRYTADRYMPDNLVAQNAINQTFFHWGFHAWVVYGMLGIMLAFITFRKGLPMTMKSCFYPLIGDRIYGWMGNVIDIMSIITTVFGVCTSLGLGTLQLNAGLNYIFPSIEKNTLTQVVIIWVVMAVATISVISGVGVGVRRLSEICFGVGMFLLMSIFFLEDSWFLLNLFCQSIGNYIQYMLGLGFRTDAFELTGIKSSQEADRGRRITPDGEADSPADWMDDWTIFYWGWWVSWSPFVSMFIAKISRGRTIRQFINGALTAPMLYSFLWLTIFGGSAIRNEKLAASLHSPETPYCCPAPPGSLNWKGASSSGNWQKEIVKKIPLSGYYDHTECTKLLLDKWVAMNEAPDIETFQVFYNNTRNRYKMAMSEDKTIVRLSCFSLDDMWFTMMFTKGKLGIVLATVSLLGIVLYFVTSADSGSLVIDIMASNGDQNPPRLQRVFWAGIEGASATALLIAGGEESLKAVQTASIVAGLPFTMILSFVCISLWRGLAMEFGDLNPYGTDFKIGIIDPFASWNPKLLCHFLKNIFMTPKVLYDTNMKHGGSKGGSTFIAVAATLMWFGWIILHLVEIEVPGCFAFAWICYIAFATLVTAARANVRSKYNINGNPLEDFFASLLVYPSVAIQLETAGEKEGTTTLVPWNHDQDTHTNGKLEGVVVVNCGLENSIELEAKEARSLASVDNYK